MDIGYMHKVAKGLYNKEADAFQVIDARNPARFNAEVKEPRAGVRSGSIKNSINLPFNVLVNDDGTFKDPQQLSKVFTLSLVDFNKPTIHTCGTGVTACIVDLGMNILGKTDSSVYDGSWSEYGSVDEPDFTKKWK